MDSEGQKIPVLIIGHGAIGCYFAAHLAQTCAVQFVTRSHSRPTFDFTLVWPDASSAEYAIPSFKWKDFPSFPTNALLLITTKAHHLADVFESLAPRLDHTHTVVLCQNGLGIAPPPGMPGTWLRMTCWMGVRFDQTSSPRVLVAGSAGVEFAALSAAREGAHAKMQMLESVLTQSGITAHILANPKELEWKKAAGNLVTNALCALVKKRNIAAVEHPRLKQIADQVLNEALMVARAEGVVLSDSTLEQMWRGLVAMGQNYNSMLVDLEQKRPTEIDWLNGAIVEKGRLLGIPTPVNMVLTQLVKALSESDSD